MEGGDYDGRRWKELWSGNRIGKKERNREEGRGGDMMSESEKEGERERWGEKDGVGGIGPDCSTHAFADQRGGWSTLTTKLGMAYDTPRSGLTSSRWVRRNVDEKQANEDRGTVCERERQERDRA